MNYNMAESYFELLTRQEGLPAKPFDPVGELKRLRRMLALRMQISQLQVKTDLPPLPTEPDTEDTPFLSFEVVPSEITEPVSLEMMVKTVSGMQKALVLWQRSRSRRKSLRSNIFRGSRQFWNKRRIPLVVTPYFAVPQEGILETVNTGLTALGVIGIVFGILSLLRGWDSDLSLGTLISVSGLTIIAIGLGGRFIASHTDFLGIHRSASTG